MEDINLQPIVNKDAETPYNYTYDISLECYSAY